MTDRPIANRLRRVGSYGTLLSTLLLTACSDNLESHAADTIVVGTLLPFTGKDATIAWNLEQAMLLAVEDVNRAGGIGRRKNQVEGAR